MSSLSVLLINNPYLLLLLHVHVVCSARVIFESDLMQDFLELKQNGGSSTSGGGATAKTTPPQGHKADRMVDLRILLPDHTLITVPVSEHWRSAEVFQVCSLW